MNRIYISRWVAIVLWICAFVAVLLLQRAVLIVTFDAAPAFRLHGYLFTGIGFVLSWIINMLYKSNRDTAIHEMGRRELEVFAAGIQQKLEGEPDQFVASLGSVRERGGHDG